MIGGEKLEALSLGKVWKFVAKIRFKCVQNAHALTTDE